MKRLFTLLTLALLVTSCGNEYSPNQAFDHDSPRGINSLNISRLQARGNDDTLSIVFIGDSQRFYDEVELFVDAVNRQSNVDLVIVAGDISDFGLLQEFKWVVRSLDQLNAPYLGVIGNHDVVANGEEVFKNMFGPLDFSFTYDSIKFIFHNTNSREYKDKSVPDLDWLSRELNGEHDVKYYIPVSHVPPFDGDFNKSIEGDYRELLSDNSRVLLSLHGHIHAHTDGYPYEDGVRYVTGHYFEERKFLRLDIHKGAVVKTIIDF